MSTKSFVMMNGFLANRTHEAAIGSKGKRQMETLIAHGLLPEEAVDLIMKVTLRQG